MTHTPAPQPAPHTKSKTLATWLAVIGGGLGLHRFYLHGLRDVGGWLHIPFTVIGVLGLQRAQQFGQDDVMSWWMLPLGGFSLAAAMLAAIVYGLRPDAQWDAQFNAGQPAERATHTGWGAVLGVIAGLLLGATVLLSSITFSFQRYFEAQVEAGRQISQ